MHRLQWDESSFTPVALDANAARFSGRVDARVRAEGRQPRHRLAELQIASVAGTLGRTLATRNPADFAVLETLVTITALG